MCAWELLKPSPPFPCLCVFIPIGGRGEQGQLIPTLGLTLQSGAVMGTAGEDESWERSASPSALFFPPSISSLSVANCQAFLATG